MPIPPVSKAMSAMLWIAAGVVLGAAIVSLGVAVWLFLIVGQLQSETEVDNELPFDLRPKER